MNNKIERQVELKAPLGRVWRALTDYKEFGQWFGVNIEEPFVEGEIARGMITYPGYEHLKWEVVIKEIQKEKIFSFTWHPYAVDPGIDYASETPTLVEFKLEENADGVLLTVVESGFDKIPRSRASKAFRMNEGGWIAQMSNIENHVAQISQQK